MQELVVVIINPPCGFCWLCLSCYLLMSFCKERWQDALKTKVSGARDFGNQSNFFTRFTRKPCNTPFDLQYTTSSPCWRAKNCTIATLLPVQEWNISLFLRNNSRVCSIHFLHFSCGQSNLPKGCEVFAYCIGWHFCSSLDNHALVLVKIA